MTNTEKRSQADNGNCSVSSKNHCDNTTRPVVDIDLDSTSHSSTDNNIIEPTTDSLSLSQPGINCTIINFLVNDSDSLTSQGSPSSSASVNPEESINIGDLVEVDGKIKLR